MLLAARCFRSEEVHPTGAELCASDLGALAARFPGNRHRWPSTIAVMQRGKVRLLDALRSYALPIVTHHHEKMDGSGYPNGLAAEEIPLVARASAIADVFDALTTERPYRKASSNEEALSVMEDEVRKGWWDAGLFAEFRPVVLRLVAEEPRPGR